jgi:hypothetical protein
MAGGRPPRADKPQPLKRGLPRAGPGQAAQLGDPLARLVVPQTLARPVVELVGDPVELGLAQPSQLGALGEVLAQQPVGAPRLCELDETPSSGLSPDGLGIGLWRDHNRRLSRGRGTRLLLAWQSARAVAALVTNPFEEDAARRPGRRLPLYASPAPSRGAYERLRTAAGSGCLQALSGLRRLGLLVPR